MESTVAVIKTRMPLFLLFAVLVAATMSCSSNGSKNGGKNETTKVEEIEPESILSPEETVTSFITAFLKKDIDTAIQYADSNTVQTLKFMQSKGMFSKKDTAVANISSVKCNTEGKKASCDVCCGKEGKNDRIALKKEKGQWKVEIKVKKEKQQPTDSTTIQ